ncbi:MAG: VWA domain-containing protein [Nanoarchaeota archaeon]|nr:VWA domain-containing protein [Nanoarchaeota archaeon]MBU1321491.1 VWA domain-containing protein [Nanoarchaeota archaeon]MBU1597375.1 VWA domain-containing protein [Nanoarchaeota archaeon]MBU2441212.1 VWA domain-containing protein [Nanoarchaeota archaeon]
MGSTEPIDSEIGKEKFSNLEEAEELTGKLSKQKEEDKLMNSVLESDKETIDDGKLLSESINQNLSSFVPDMIFKNLVNDYKLAKQLYGEVIIRQLSGYEPGFVEKNIKIPEFQEEIKKRIDENVKKLKQKELVNKEGEITEQGLKLSSLILYTEELDKLKIKGLGEKKEKKKDIYGDKKDYHAYKKTRYRDIAIRQSVKTAIRRQHKQLQKEDLRIFERERKGGISIIYALDASGSMKGNKLGTGKRAGVALAYKAIAEKNKVGLIVFGDDVKKIVPPTLDFNDILMSITSIRARSETDIAKTIEKAIEVFGNAKETKHLILLTDVIPTKGKKPETDTLRAVSMARDQNITISIIGINLDKDGEKLAKRMIEISQGRVYKVKNLENLDTVILEDYYSV